MPGEEVREFKLKATIEGLDRAAEQIGKAVEKAITNVHWDELIGGAVEEAEGGEKGEKAAKPQRGGFLGILDKIGKFTEPFEGLAKRMTGGLLSKETMGAVVGAVGGGAAGAAEGGMAGGTAGGLVGGGFGMALGPILGILTMMAGALESLAPIQAILKVIGSIMSLAMLPLALVLMAILMPFLMPLLQILGKLPWKEIFAATQMIGAVVAKYLPYILFPLLILIQLVIRYWPQIVQFLQMVWNAIVQVAKFIYQVDMDIVRGFLYVAGIFVKIGTMIWSVIQTVWSVLNTIWGWFNGVVGDVFTDIRTAVMGAWNVLQDIAGAFKTIGNTLNPSNWASGLTSWIPKFQTGGYVPQNTLAFLHAGETVIPASGGGGGGGTGAQITINVNNPTVSKPGDIQELAQQVAQVMQLQVRKLKTW
jgi:hypothetical protein